MEQKLAWSQSNDSNTQITRLEGEIEEQRQLRLQDARQVEAKAARIKEWVTNKLRELEQQNQHLKEQNIKCNQQLELLRNHIALSDRRRSESISPEPSRLSSATSRSSRHRRHQSVCISSNSFEPALPVTSFINTNLIGNTAFIPNNTNMDALSDDLRAAVDNLSLGKMTTGSASDPDLAHDYAEIYTPSREKVPWPRAPTPPLHRFPSWEDRIYQVAADGLTLTGTTPSDMGPEQAGYQDIPVPVYATVKGRASQIRSMPFTGDSSDDSSDGEGNNTAATEAMNTHSRSSGDTSGSSPGKRTASSSSGSPSKSKTRDTSFESGMSDDYAVPPDAFSCDSTSMESSALRTSFVDSPKKSDCIEKSGSLAKLGGKLKTWRKRWFVLKNGVLTYYKSQADINRKPQGQILLDEICKINRAEGSNTFEIDTGKKTYYLTADSITAMEDWVRTLQNVQRRNATRLLLSKEENKPLVQGWLTKVKNGHAKKCWCVLIGKMFLYFKTPTDTSPAGQINMRDARVEEVDHMSDSDSEEKECEATELTLGIFPNNQGPTYLLCPGKQERDAWLYHLTVASGGGPNTGTQYEQLIHKLMEVDGDPNCVLWRHPVLVHVSCTKDGAIPSYFPLTTLPSETMQAEAIKLFKCLQLFMSAQVDQAGIDYHVILAQNALQQCLDMPELQPELICALIKQTSKVVPLPKLGVQVSTQKLLKKSQLLLCATQSLFTCEATPTGVSSASEQQISSSNTQGSQEDKYKEHKECYKEHKDHKGPPSYTFLQGWQLLALAVSLFVPKSSRLLWFLKLHLQRNADNRTECGKYASYCERALDRTILTGGRECKPSRMEVLSILLKNPQHHSLPHSMPVHLLNGTYHISSFDGSSTVKEFQDSLATEIGCRISNGFALFSDDPIEKDLEHTLDPSAKLCDVITKWEVALREKGLGKFENTRVIRLTYKSRLWWKSSARLETDKERLLLCYQVNKQIVSGRFPLSKELALELAAVMAQLDIGDCSFSSNKSTSIANTLNSSTQGANNNAHQSPNCTTKSSLHGTLSPPKSIQSSQTLNALNSVHNILTAHSNQALSAIDKFYPYRYRDQLSQEGLADLQSKLLDKWRALKGRTQLDCVRIYLTCTRKWPFFGATLFQARLRQHESSMVWLAVNEDSITVLDLATMQQRMRYSYTNVLTFGGCQEDFMLVVTQSEQQPSQKLIFSLSKPKILELTLLIADYMNLLMQNPGTPLLGTLSRGTVMSVNQSVITNQSQPDILKSTPDHALQRSDSKRRTHIDSGLA
ncbi:uncharacterized protein CG43867 isoform X2 [Agrilus planipennis]|uniref:Uncharacterized protein CG43867 isoform X2 n=1 Tax=Agrilus planipennis TaxID=224129 RepID=A0A1W4XVB9_AGRPL|nr:uncharacterized protein CG43867 isoform X2 [Agrilus planipennis]